ncbi:MAG: NUDIX hydrolase [Spirochaetaceae bacterium]|jgi:8-oxo-dGTP pyrophosphatase MutT (NUDIX family)|nr:NUDIX hydrolase [Spirochaetaceae bacterium]
MDNTSHSNLTWREEARKTIFQCPVFSVRESSCRSPDNGLRNFTVLDAPDWAIVAPLLETPRGASFVMVRQWRHGSQCLSLEFPGGVLEPGESPEQAALRELREETAYTPGKILRLGAFNPNPAIMSNQVHFFLAQDLRARGVQNLDEDEYVDVEIVPVGEVMRGMGSPPYIHALMGSALALYNRYENESGW